MTGGWVSLRRTSFYAAVYLALIGLPQAALFLAKPALQAAFGADWWLVPFFVMMGTSVVAPLFYTVLQRRAQVLFLRERRRYLDTLIQGAQGMTMVRDLKRLLNLIVHILSRTVRVDSAAIWLFDPESSRYVLHVMRSGDGGKREEAVGADSPLIRRLASERRPLVREDPQVSRPLIREMERFRAAVIIPSFLQDRMIGFVTLSQRKGGEPYLAEDLEVFQVLSNQAALAIENAQFYEELKRTQADLFQTAKLASLGQMAGGMSHQINNRFHVLTILAGTMKSALKDLDPASMEAERLKGLWTKAAETLAKIEDNALRGGDIVKTLLRFSRPGSIEAKPISLKEVVATALDVAQYKIDMNSIDFVEEWPKELPMVNGNLNQLADSFFNLITNAYDAIRAREERLNEPGYRGRITISGHPSLNGVLSIDVTDNGLGMGPEQREQLFVPFFTTKATAEKGTGLGLFVIKRILEHHGGNIEVRSTQGEGTTFTISLPSGESRARVA
ncbi:MAG: GAF domain-containing protein [Candidatus Omnitrophica bacterium]|nr:GAF domain-containing protein [Candidatus Omnitrophota bacterium]